MISEGSPTARRRLIVTADDFGADVAVNEAVEVAHRQGVLTAASLMVGAPAVADAVTRARRTPSLAVGLHLVLTDGRPVLPAAEVPLLTDRDGRFDDDMARAGARMFFHPFARRQLEAEIAAQFAAFAATGLTLDHVNAHKHFHLHPTIGGLILKIGRRYGLAAARVPTEPRQVLNAVEPGCAPPTISPISLIARATRARFRRAGVATPDQVFGLRWSGAMTTARLRGLIDALPAGLTEIYLHPALWPGYPGSATGYDYAGEFAALTAREVVEAATKPGIARGGFQDLA